MAYHCSPFLLSKWMERTGCPTEYLPAWANELCTVTDLPTLEFLLMICSLILMWKDLGTQGKAFALDKEYSFDSPRPCQSFFSNFDALQREICRGGWQDSFPPCAWRLLIPGHWEENSLDWEFILEWVFSQQVSEGKKKKQKQAHIISNNGNKQYKFF